MTESLGESQEETTVSVTPAVGHEAFLEAWFMDPCLQLTEQDKRHHEQWENE
jgi:hypothetical protein